MWCFLKSQLGVSMVESLLAFGLLGGAALVVADSVSKSNERGKDKEARVGLMKARSLIIQTLRSPDATSNIANVNGVPCLETMASCSATDWTDFTVLNGAGEKFTDKDSASFGFTLAGKSCTSFPTAACPFQYKSRYKIICSDPSCLVPQFKFQASLTVHEDYKKIPYKQYEFEITAGQEIDSYERSCTSLGGTYQPGTPPSCILPLLGDCPTAPDGTFQAVVGFDSVNNQKICKPLFKNYLNGKTCKATVDCSPSNPTGTPGEVMIGVAANGDPICVPIRFNPGCATLCDSSPECLAYKCQQDPSFCPPMPTFPDPGPAADSSSWSTDGGCGADGGPC